MYFAISTISAFVAGLRGLACRNELDRFAHRDHSRCEVSNADAVADQRLSIPLRVPAIHVAGADFQLERGRDTVHRFETIVLFVLTMLMKVDEAGRNDVGLFRVDYVAAVHAVGRDGLDRPARDADVAHSIEFDSDRSRGRSRSRRHKLDLRWS